MDKPPILTDRAALMRNRNRAHEMLFHQEICIDVDERLIEVNRSFTNPCIITPFSQVWGNFSKNLTQSPPQGPQDPPLPSADYPSAKIIPDTDLLDLEPGAHDLIIHALCLHWANDPVGQLVQCQRALRPDGLFLCYAFGGQTLHELRSSLAQAEAQISGGLSPRILPMAEIRDLGGLLQRAGFALPVADSYRKCLHYRDVFHLMHDLRAMGENNALATRSRKPPPRALFAQAAAFYDQAHGLAGAQNDISGQPHTAGEKPQEWPHTNKIPATFEIICLTGWAPAPTQPRPLRPGSAKTSLAEALGGQTFGPDGRPRP